MFSAQYNWC